MRIEWIIGAFRIAEHASVSLLREKLQNNARVVCVILSLMARGEIMERQKSPKVPRAVQPPEIHNHCSASVVKISKFQNVGDVYVSADEREGREDWLTTAMMPWCQTCKVREELMSCLLQGYYRSFLTVASQGFQNLLRVIFWIWDYLLLLLFTVNTLN
jgi:hypothetical protein